MSLEFMDGFDHYNNGTSLIRKGWSSNSNFNTVKPGRFGGQAVQFDNASASLFSPFQPVATRTVGFAFLWVYGTTNGPLCAFMDGGTTQFDVRINSSYQLSVTRNGTVIATTSQTVSINTWYYVEFQVTIGASGSYTLKVVGTNPTVLLSGTGINTQSTGNSTTNGITFGGYGIAQLCIDDFYALNSSGTANNTFLGESKIVTSLPSADSSVNAAWTPNNGSAHYSRVNEASPDDDTSYNSTATVGANDSYVFPTVSLTGPVIAVQNNLTARKDDVGGKSLSSLYRNGGTNYVSSTQNALGTSYSDYRQIYETDPSTGAAWTNSGLNAAEFGVTLSS